MSATTVQVPVNTATAANTPTARGPESSRRGPLARIVGTLKRQRPGVILAGVYLVVVAVACLLPQLFTSADPIQQDLLAVNQAPSLEHIAGTDYLGRDLFARIVYGARYSIGIGIAVTLISLFFGAIIGLFAGTARSRIIDTAFMRAIDVLSSFPSVLLVTTLFRLGISIATTRLILLQGDAGHIIFTFGNFVVGGNLVVGLVVFLILTIVQFVVITKGAERVAEVAARFSLDAMPGKQMSIDGDMRAGTIDMEEAKRRRGIVEKESQLYGAMDGAMKFVKGDAIAGLIIVAVNLLGGIVIGTMQRGMTAADAAKTYSVLTIGDGLIAQIPALFIAICAGMIVTRVQSGDGPSNVGKDIGQQVMAQPRALMIAAAVALFLSRALNSLSLGSDTATALGNRVARTQLIGLLAITVLCGSATAVVGPIAFIGLMMPHMARWLVGADHRWSLPVTLLATPSLLLIADIIGRLIVPGELRVSVVSAFIGAPVLIFLVRRKSRGGGA